MKKIEELKRELKEAKKSCIQSHIDSVANKLDVALRLEELRTELRNESISYGELAELQSLAEHIDKDDVELLEAAGVPEFPKEEEKEGTLQLLNEIYKTIDILKSTSDSTFHGHDGNELINVEIGKFYGSIDKLNEVMHLVYKLHGLKQKMEESEMETEPCYKCGHVNEMTNKWCDECLASLS